MVNVASAISNAIYPATGLRLTDLFMTPDLTLQGSAFRVEEYPTNFYHTDSIYTIILMPFHPMGDVGHPDPGQYDKQVQAVVTFEP